MSACEHKWIDVKKTRFSSLLKRGEICFKCDTWRVLQILKEGAVLAIEDPDKPGQFYNTINNILDD